MLNPSLSICPPIFCTGVSGTSDRRSKLGERTIVVLMVLTLHIACAVIWRMQPEVPKKRVKEMTVTVAIQQAALVQSKLPPLPQPRPQPKVEHIEKIVARPIVEDAVEVQKTPVVMTAPSVGPVVAASPAALPAPIVETEPDFKADYLHNPQPVYPLIARRMHYHGKVLLDVEVLSDGFAGQIKLHRSSGYEALDISAREAVKTWHFTPAKRAGQSISKWFIVPINFTLEDTQA